jgi:sodium-dependent dicarboxylate transporter 2/3/5
MRAARRALVPSAVAAASVAAYLYTSGLLGQGERAALAILIIAAGLWITEAAPLPATALLVPLLQSLLGVRSFGDSLRPFFDPVVMLLLGGFLLAAAVEKYDLDEYFASQVVSRVRADARILLLVMMTATMALSLWISNTAAAAIMMTLALKLVEGAEDKGDNFPKALVLGIAYSATVGGVGTLVGTTTTAMAAGTLKRLTGAEITFLGWILYGLPVSLLMVLASWALLISLFPFGGRKVSPSQISMRPLGGRQMLTLAVFAVSIILWITERVPDPLIPLIGWRGHGLSSSIVAAIIAVILFFSGLLDERDLSRVNWGVLILIGGGLSLGEALEVSGLMNRIGEALLIFTRGAGTIPIILIVSLFGLVITVVASNTASAAIFLPIAIGIAASTGIDPAVLAAIVGITTSLDFMLPVGTPPNAIAYSTGKVSLREMVKAGLILDILGWLITSALAIIIWPHIA